ncbi:MAG: lysozyme [Bacteroidales bacterium]|jgi:lysozyme|nr:lysozyme [Bacteroidales bacterium]
MKTSPKGIALIKEFEGLRLKAYQCPGGVWTIGYGHTAGVKPGMLISKAQAEEYLKADLIAFERYLNGLGLALNQNQFDALVSFIYNVGTGNFSNSTLLRKVRANPQENSIMDEFLRWVYSKGRVLPGLQRRRLAEMKLYFSND